MDNIELTHWGIKGMKWGVRRFQNRDGSLTAAGKKRRQESGDSDDKDAVEQKASSSNASNKKSISEMSNEEIQDMINRLSLEKRLRELMSTPAKNAKDKQKAKVKEVVSSILESSIKNIGGQTVTYIMGGLVNNVAGKDIVNPKKGQKDK